MASQSESSGSIAALNQVLSELIDLVQDVKQAHRKVPENHVLHAELDQLFADLRAWAGSLMEEDLARGVSPLTTMPTVAGRTPKNLWPSAASDDSVRQTITDLLENFSEHLSVALLEESGDERVISLFARIQGELATHVQELAISEG